MPGNPPDEAQARIAYYQERRQLGAYLGDPLFFYPGASTVPQNATANLIAIGDGNGPGAKILNGIGPVVPVAECDEVVITDLQVAFVDPTLTVNVVYNVLPGDIITLFNTNSGQVLVPTLVTPILGGLSLEFDMTAPPVTAGSWSFKIARAENLDCFAVRNGIFQFTGAVCAIDAGAWTYLGGVPFGPVLGAGPPISAQITGSGFLSCPIGVSVERDGMGSAPLNQTVSSLVVVNDNLITFDVSRDGIVNFGTYLAIVFCTDAPGCSDEADNTLFYVVF